MPISVHKFTQNVLKSNLYYIVIFLWSSNVFYGENKCEWNLSASFTLHDVLREVALLHCVTSQTTAARSKQVRDFLGILSRHCFVIPRLIGLTFYLDFPRLDVFIVIVFVPKCTRVDAIT